MHKYKPQTEKEVDIKQLFDLDKDIKKLMKILPDGSEANKLACFKIDTICKSFTYITAYTMVGKGPTIKVPTDKEAEREIKNWNNNININNETLDDLLVGIWRDEIIHGFHAWIINNRRRDINNNLRDLPDVQRIPPRTLKMRTDQIEGWRVLEQSIDVTETYSTPNKFIKGEYEFNRKENRRLNITIPISPEVVLYGSYFHEPPMDTVVPYVVFKHWILAFMRKFAEKSWAPLMLGFVGDSDHWPVREEMDEQINKMSTYLNQLKNHSTAAFPGNTDIKIENIKNNGQLFLDYFDKMNEQIMFGLFSSISVRDSNSVYKGNEIADESTIRFVEGVRDRIEMELKRFYVTNIATDLEFEDIQFIWPELRISSVQNMSKALEVASKNGIFNGTEERRRAFSTIFPWLSMKQIDDKDAKKLDDMHVLFNAPSQKEEDTVSIAKKSEKSNNSKNR